jgi:Ankyrin repeats (many copies)
LTPRLKNHAMSEYYRKPRGGWQGLPLLNWAAQHGAVDVVKALLESGADALNKDKDGQTAIQVATKSEFLKQGRHHYRRLEDMESAKEILMEILGDAGR